MAVQQLQRMNSLPTEEEEEEANQNPTTIPEDEFDAFKRANEELISLMTIEGGFLSILSQQDVFCTTLYIAIVVIVIYFNAISLNVICFSANSSPIGRGISEKLVLFIGALADILLLLIILPPFGWLAFLLWAIALIVFAMWNRSVLCDLIIALGIQNQNLFYGNGGTDQAEAPLPEDLVDVA